jgi:hypothetical protein
MQHISFTTSSFQGKATLQDFMPHARPPVPKIEVLGIRIHESRHLSKYEMGDIRKEVTSNTLLPAPQNK